MAVGCGGVPLPNSEKVIPAVESPVTRSSIPLSVHPTPRLHQDHRKVPFACPLFIEVSTEVGVQFQYDNGATGKALMIESAGGGAGWLDYDGDGSWDLYLVQGGNPTPKPDETLLPDCLYRNMGDGRFRDVSRLAGVTDGGYGYGAAVGDYDNDGFDDLYVTNVGHNVLYHNLGDGTFQEVTEAADVDDPRWSTSAAWGDLDHDGDLDLFVCNYLKYDPFHPFPCPKKDGSPGICHPQDLPAEPNEVFLNHGDGTFRRVAHEWGLDGEEKDSKSLGVVIADLNGDGRVDVYVANDTTANFLFVNQGQGRFQESAAKLGCAMNGQGSYQASMGVAVGDYDRNGFLDLYVTHFTDDSNTLYQNLGPAGFHDSTRTTGLHQPTLKYLGFGTVMADFNQDGHEDLFVTNGHIDDWRDKGELFEMPPQLFTYTGTKWEECSEKAGQPFREQRIGRAVASCDFDDDGDLDLAVVHQNTPTWLLRNDSQRGHWLKVRLIGRSSNRRGVGSQVTLRQGQSVLVQQLMGGTSYCASHQPVLVFGLGESNANCSIEIRWPSGISQQVDNIEPDRSLVLMEPEK